MEQPILVINRIGTLRRLTIQILKNLGYHRLTEVENLLQAEKKLRENFSPGIILLELGGSWLKTPVFDFMDLLVTEGWNQKYKVISTLEIHDHSVIKQLKEKGIQEVIYQTFNLTTFSDDLNSALKKIPPLT